MRLAPFVCPVLLAALGVQLACVRKTEVPDLVSRDAVYTIEDGRVVRIPAYRGQEPVIGQCVDGRYGLSEGCMDGGACKPVGPDYLDHLNRQGYRSSSSMLSVQTGIEIDAGASKGKTKVTLSRHRLFIEWNRYQVISLDPATTRSPGAEGCSYVSAMERGIGIRIILDTSLSNVDAETTLTFGFGQVAAAVALGKAQIDVQYDTMGVPQDILPPNLPTSVASVDDLAKVVAGLHQAVAKISETWNDKLEQTGAPIGPTTNAPLPDRATGSTMPEGTGDTITDEFLGELGKAHDDLDTIEDKSKFPQLFHAGGEPIVPDPEDLSYSELGDALAQYAEDLVALDPNQRKLLPANVIDLGKLGRTIELLESFPQTPEDGLLPRGFTAYPIAYYVVRNPKAIARDQCLERKFKAAANRERVDVYECEQELERDVASEPAPPTR